MPGVILYYISLGLWTAIRAAFSHPIIAGIFLLLLAGFSSCSYNGNWFSTDLPALMRANEASIEQYAGSPESCSNIAGDISCQYTGMSVTMVRGRVSTVNYTRLNGEPFNLNAEFYGRVLGMLGVSYREPDHATIDEVIWRVPGVGTIRATSDEKMNVAGVTVSA